MEVLRSNKPSDHDGGGTPTPQESALSETNGGALAPEQGAEVQQHKENANNQDESIEVDETLPQPDAVVEEVNEPHIPGISKYTDLQFYGSLFSIDASRLSATEREYHEERFLSSDGTQMTRRSHKSSRTSQFVMNGT